MALGLLVTRDIRRHRNCIKKQSHARENSVTRRQATNTPPTRIHRASYAKRCHVVIHNLDWKFFKEDIDNRVKELTGEWPIISHAFKCSIIGRKAFRVTCLFKYLDKLKCENFGINVKISRYSLSNDYPVGRLMPLQQPGTRHVPTQRTTSQVSSSPGIRGSSHAVGDTSRFLRSWYSEYKQ